MTTQLKALPSRTESSPAIEGPSQGAPEERLAPRPIDPVDFDGTAALSDGVLRTQARDGGAPGVRLAACWRLMVRGQALPQTAPTEGVRLLTLMNLATLQDLELLEVLVCFDPCASVRAQAATLLWRVTRDRDRVVSLLVSRLRAETSPEVVKHLLALQPPLPPDQVGDFARARRRKPPARRRRPRRSTQKRVGEGST